MGAEAAAIAAAEATIANSIKANGVVVRVEPEDFAGIPGKADKGRLFAGRLLLNQLSVSGQL